MSNYNFRELPESLAKDFGEEISIGAEVINGTGDVQLVFHDGDPNAPMDANVQSVFLHLTVRQARDLAEEIYHAACDADWAKRRDRCVGDQKAEWYKGERFESTALFGQREWCGKDAQRVDEWHTDLGPCRLTPGHDGGCTP